MKQDRRITSETLSLARYLIRCHLVGDQWKPSALATYLRRWVIRQQKRRSRR